MNDPLDSAIYFVYKIIDNSSIFVKRFIYSGPQEKKPASPSEPLARD